MAERFTVLGASGFIGGALVAHLRKLGHEVHSPGRAEVEAGRFGGRELGHVIYAIGRTADFRSHLLDTLDAHLVPLIGLLRRGGFSSLLYLSSTRVYGAQGQGGHEDDPLTVHPADASDLYNISKLAGESACLTDRHPTVRVARLSNVHGEGMDPSIFLASVLRAAVGQGRVVFGGTPESRKDYVSIEDTVAALTLIALRGDHRLYNVAAGASVTHGEIARLLRHHLDCETVFRAGAPEGKFPLISVSRLRDSFGADLGPPATLADRLPDLIAMTRRALAAAAKEDA